MLTIPNAQLIVSFVISTHNRKAALLDSIARIRRCGLARECFEILVVDNASTDGTAAMLALHCPDVQVVQLDRNLGACSKNVVLSRTLGRYVMFLDDDSSPVRGAMHRMIAHFEADPKLGAAGFQIALDQTRRECSAYPDILVGCGAAFRRQALMSVDALPDDFFKQAEEYDLTLRLLGAGWRVEIFEDLAVLHRKSALSRTRWQTMRLDVRNNLMVALRNLPEESAGPIARDWLRRYWKMASASRQRSAFVVGAAQGLTAGLNPSKRAAVQSDVLERFTRSRQIDAAMKKAADELLLQRVIFVDYGKNMLPYWKAAESAGVEVLAIADQRLAGSGDYRNVPIVDDNRAAEMNYDAVVISNSSPVHASVRASMWRARQNKPVLDFLSSGNAKIAA